MRRALCLLVITAMVLLAPGCGTGNSPEAGITREDLFLTIGETAYRCDMDIEEVIGSLGTGYSYAEGMSCDYDGLDKTYQYEMATFFTNPLAEGDMVNEIYTTDPSVATSKGIAVGMTKADVLSAYGEEYEDSAGLMVFGVAGERASLCFDIVDDVVVEIYLTTQPV